MIRFKQIDFDTSQKVAIAEAVGAIMEGELDALLVRGFATQTHCEEIAKRFFASDEAKPRGDNVPGIMVGESHYFNDPHQYYDRCDQTSSAVAELFGDSGSPVQNFYSVLNEGLEQQIRPAEYEGRRALHTRAIQWVDKVSREFLLQPHDDVSQVFCERNEGWEICDISTLVAVNFYARCEEGEGMLRVFDLRHSDELSEELGLSCAGYPYPADMLQDASHIDIPVKTGDFALLNGALIHGVTKAASNRIVMNSFIGDVNDQEIVYWT